MTSIELSKSAIIVQTRQRALELLPSCSIVLYPTYPSSGRYFFILLAASKVLETLYKAYESDRQVAKEVRNFSRPKQLDVYTRNGSVVYSVMRINASLEWLGQKLEQMGISVIDRRGK